MWLQRKGHWPCSYLMQTYTLRRQDIINKSNKATKGSKASISQQSKKQMPKPVDCAQEPLQLLHGVLGGFIAHAALYFKCNFLHRNISCQNLLFTSSAIPIFNGDMKLHP